MYTRKKPIIRQLWLSCNIAIYYRLIIYSNIKDVLFGQKAVKWNNDVGIWVEKSFGGQAEGFGSWRQN